MSNASATPPLSAETIGIGTELLIGGRSDSNSLFLADELGKLGIAVRFKSVVGDERQDIVTAIQRQVGQRFLGQAAIPPAAQPAVLIPPAS